jgi:hypothetical protein
MFKRKAYMKYVTFFSLIFSLILLFLGSWVYTYRFSFAGAAGWALGDKKTTNYSLLSMGNIFLFLLIFLIKIIVN